MLGSRVAIYNFGIHVAAYDAPEIEGFRLREPLNFEAARCAAGFVARSGYDGEPGPPSWGKQVFPRFLSGSGHETGPSSLSLWEDIESLMAFSYGGVHAEALRGARNWNLPQRWPPFVLWWVDPGHRPEWKEAVKRFEYLHDNGPSPYAFNFKQPFAANGDVAVIDRALVKQKAQINEAAQRELLTRLKSLGV
ncbi:DUF3291 domain-containing protein [Rhizobiaceae bacterium n13]|uniref:DUF3291 domain-containing protein n=1 Tax=Ferirhizobium litorale TaxID=2927786 RepID=A0AAE3U3G7_9HYPH|nr:DUF3291 domain-containing protein [Fererhizobium litorale]MDI7864254.1 DUF3291 domain-containing protein [Fererhizobium litorale]MDI7924641.1 DUF3291 domain-containing protein [Fererhizobium litorale]